MLFSTLFLVSCTVSYHKGKVSITNFIGIVSCLLRQGLHGRVTKIERFTVLGCFMLSILYESEITTELTVPTPPIIAKDLKQLLVDWGYELHYKRVKSFESPKISQNVTINIHFSKRLKKGCRYFCMWAWTSRQLNAMKPNCTPIKIYVRLSRILLRLMSLRSGAGCSTVSIFCSRFSDGRFFTKIPSILVKNKIKKRNSDVTKFNSIVTSTSWSFKSNQQCLWNESLDVYFNKLMISCSVCDWFL